MARSRHANVLSNIVASFGPDGVRGAEVGTLRGDTSRRLLEGHPNLFLIMIDSWEPPAASSPYASSQDSAAIQTPQKHLENMVTAYQQTSFAESRRNLLRCSSATAAKMVPEQSLDFAFIDADHTYQQVRNDIWDWWPKVRKGGVLCGHDYNSLKERRGLWGVKKAVDEFALELNLPVEQHGSNVWVIPKSKTCVSSRQASQDTEPAIVRVLFGDQTDNDNLTRQVRATLKSEWCRTNIVHATASSSYRQLLEREGATRILDFTERYEDERASHPDRHAKPYLIRRVMDSHSEILFLDFDCRIHRRPDTNLWDRIREKGGRFSGELQAASVCYRRRCRLRVFPGGRVQRIRQCLNSSALYCADSEWIDKWLDAYTQLRELDIDLTGKGDETPLLYSLEHRFGVLTPEIVARDFELAVHSLRRKSLVKKQPDSVYFSHR